MSSAPKSGKPTNSVDMGVNMKFKFIFRSQVGEADVDSRFLQGRVMQNLIEQSNIYNYMAPAHDYCYIFVDK